MASSLRRLLARLSAAPAAPAGWPARPRWRFQFRPGVTPLEDRYLLTMFTVTTAADNGPGSLRDIIDNQATDDDTINFADSLNGATIALTGV